MKIFERWMAGINGVELLNKSGNLDHFPVDVREWLSSNVRVVGDTYPNHDALYVCVADEPVYELRVDDGSLEVIDENGGLRRHASLADRDLQGIFRDFMDIAQTWEKFYSIPVETTLRAVLNYYHKKFCVDSAGEVDGE